MEDLDELNKKLILESIEVEMRGEGVKSLSLLYEKSGTVQQMTSIANQIKSNVNKSQ
jgi:hypothetical protein